ncbi:rhomboid family-domain-containing protein [Parasitella parasitica]|nr:rhomboid family-domain-containing protein [Parasitella parasitica]
MSSSPPPPPHHSYNSNNNSAWESLELHQRRSVGFQKLNSNDPSPSGTPLENGRYYSPPTGQQPYQNGPPPGQQPYYNATPPPHGQYYGGPPPMNQPYPLIQVQESLPHGYDRNPFIRFFIGPVETPYFSYISALGMTAMLIYEFVKMHNLTGDVIETNPFNPMIGPSFQVLVNTGARFTPCIRTVPSLPSSTIIGDCYRNTTDTCSIEELCGFGGFKNGVADQAFRLALPVIMHAGVVHFLLNMLTHLRLGVDLEKALGTVRYVILYAAAGVYGFILSAMLSQNLTASTGCSGALFGLIGYMFIDVLVNWKVLPHPIRDLMSLLVSTIISLVLGLLPGLDNFAHIGGFAVGIFMGMMICPMRPMASKKVIVFTWIVRCIALAILVVLFAVSIKEFYSAADPSKICPNCKYLSCLPVNNWCDPV